MLGALASFVSRSNTRPKPLFAYKMRPLTPSTTAVADESGDQRNATATPNNSASNIVTSPSPPAGLTYSWSQGMATVDATRHVRYITNIPVNTANGFTFCAWIYQSNITAGVDSIFVEFDSSNAFYIHRRNAGGLSWNYDTTTWSITNNTWQHVAVVTTVGAGATYTVYVNGTVAAGLVGRSYNHGGSLATANNLGGTSIGRSFASKHLSLGGFITDVRAYNQMLTAAQISAIAAGSG